MSAGRAISPIDAYHVVNRGVGRQIIFADERDYFYLFEKLERLSEKVGVYAWCFMPNHFHLLLKGKIETISRCVADFEGSYARRFNKLHKRSGALFQDQFFSEPILNYQQLISCVRYIHLNPVKAGIAELGKYSWSSYFSYIQGGSNEYENEVFRKFPGVKTFEAFHKQQEDQIFGDEHSLDKRMSDSVALGLAKEIFGEDFLSGALLIDPKKRKETLRILQSRGMSVAQISRLTGYSAPIVAKFIGN